MDDQRGRTIQQALAKVPAVNLSGVLRGLVYLTPPDVKQTGKVGWVEHWEFVIDPRVNSSLLAPQATLNWSQGIFLGGVTFPEVCCKCMEPATYFELAEAGIRTRTWSGRVVFPGKEQEEVDRILAAYKYTRFWYAVPFCQKHGLKSRAVHIHSSASMPKTDDDWKMILDFSNPEYGRQFAQINGLEGIWIDRPVLLKLTALRILGIVIFVLGLPLVLIGGQSATSFTSPLDLVGLCVAGLVWAVGVILVLAGIGLFRALRE